MLTRQNRRLPQALVLLVAALAIGAVISTSGAFATPQRAAAVRTFDLCATAGTLQPLPATDATVQIPIWGFATHSGLDDCSGDTAALPGPVLDVDDGDDVTVNLWTALPNGHTASFELPGLAVDTSCTVPAGAAACFHFIAGRPGTFEYHSPADAGRQAAMGLYGALIVRPATAGQAYNDASTAYDVEAPLVLSAVDPLFNADPDGFNMHAYNATYWLINGRSYPDTARITATAGQTVLLRYVNGGFDNSTMTLLGADEVVVGRDAYPLDTASRAVAETIPAGATEDAIVTVPAGSSALPNGLVLYNRQFHITNGTAAYTNYNPGGMMTFIGP
jgi:FtsP/CotA-like multicopper oxidase with cupredoxin domain